MTRFKRLLPKLYLICGLGAVLGVLMMVFIWSHTALHDLDIWLHLKTGQLILENKAFLYSDPFSFTFASKPWANHEWLFQVISYLAYSRWQADGLIFLQSFILVLSFLVLFLIGRRAGCPRPVIALLMLVAAAASSGRFNIRPEIFSLLFFALYLLILRFYLDKKILWLIVPLQVLWVNFHGYFFLGVLLVFIYFSSEFLRRKVKSLPAQWREEGALGDGDYRRLKKVMLFTVLACLLNPNGLQGALYPAHIVKGIFSGSHQIFFKYIQELQPTFRFDQPLSSNRHFSIILTLAPLFMFINFRRLRMADLFLLIFFLLFSLKVRNVAFFVFTGYLLIVSNWPRAIKRCSSGISVSGALKQALYFISIVGVSFTIMHWAVSDIDASLSVIYYDFYSKEFKSMLSGIDQRRYPVAAADFVLANDIPGNMFNDFNSGSYLIGRAYPARSVFIDGRTEFYGQDFFGRYMKSLAGNEDAFNSIARDYKINAVFINTTLNPPAKIIAYLYKSPQWKPIFMDASAVIFLKDAPENRALIEKYRIDFKKYSLPAPDIKSLAFRRVFPGPFIRRAKLFYLLEEDALVEAEAKEALRVMPGCAEAYHFLGKVYLRKGLYKEARDNLRWAILLFSNNTEMLVDLAACLKETGEYAPAINALKKALRLDPTYAKAQYQLGLIYLDKKKAKDALWALKRALDLATQDEDEELVREIKAKLRQPGEAVK